MIVPGQTVTIAVDHTDGYVDRVCYGTAAPGLVATIDYIAAAELQGGPVWVLVHIGTGRALGNIYNDPESVQRAAAELAATGVDFTVTLPDAVTLAEWAEVVDAVVGARVRGRSTRPRVALNPEGPR